MLRDFSDIKDCMSGSTQKSDIPGLYQIGFDSGVPTRILKWTYSLGYAVFCAIEAFKKDSGSTPKIYALDPITLNKLHGHSKLYTVSDDKTYEYCGLHADLDKTQHNFPIAVRPGWKNPTHAAQQVQYTIHGTLHHPLDEIEGIYLKRLDVDIKRIFELENQINIVGINRGTANMTRESLAEWETECYGFKKNRLG
ncbi:MAG: hypothetical protein HRU19_08440 [Pseudobacteriovorax sp.]|nr:hypothetical protein [Pseudobacteriovorax sp.]